MSQKPRFTPTIAPRRAASQPVPSPTAEPAAAAASIRGGRRPPAPTARRGRGGFGGRSQMSTTAAVVEGPFSQGPAAMAAASTRRVNFSVSSGGGSRGGISKKLPHLADDEVPMDTPVSFADLDDAEGPVIINEDNLEREEEGFEFAPCQLHLLQLPWALPLKLDTDNDSLPTPSQLPAATGEEVAMDVEAWQQVQQAQRLAHQQASHASTGGWPATAQGEIGLVRVHASGRLTLQIGPELYEVASLPIPPGTASCLAIDAEAGLAYDLGPLQRHLVGTPHTLE